jgi:hypothetical protein
MWNSCFLWKYVISDKLKCGGGSWNLKAWNEVLCLGDNNFCWFCSPGQLSTFCIYSTPAGNATLIMLMCILFLLHGLQKICFLLIYLIYWFVISSVCARLLLWHLDPSILKHDLSVMLQETIRRPLLCLRKELHDRMEWRIIIICLVCSPTMFMEMRSLLHFWFLAT